MDTHVQRLGALSIAFGIAGTLVSLLTLWYFGGMTALFDVADEHRLGLVAAGVTTAHLVLGIPCVVVGVYLRKLQPWARLTMIGLCGLNLLNPPFGSALGLYGLWVLMTPETDPLFKDKPVRATGPARQPDASRRPQKSPAIAPRDIKATEPHLPD